MWIEVGTLHLRKKEKTMERGVKTLALNEFCYKNGIPWHKEKMIEYMENFNI